MTKPKKGKTMGKSKASARTSGSKSKATKKAPARLPSFFGRQLGKPAIFIAVFAFIGLGTLLYSLAAVPTGQIKLKANGECLENFYNRQLDGNFISTYPCQSTNQAQQWSIYSSDKSIRTAQNYCLDVQKGGKTPKTKVHLWRCTGGVPQKWDILSSGQLRNPNSMLCLEADSKDTFLGGPNMYVNTCNASNTRQIWTAPTTAIPLPTPSPTPTNPPAPAPPASTGSGIPGPSNTGPTSSVSPRGAITITQDGFVLRNFHIAGTGKTTRYGIVVQAKNVVIEDGIVEKASSTGIYVMSGASATIRRVEIRETGGDGIKFHGVSGLMEGNWGHHLGRSLYSATPTDVHADFVQSQGGQNLVARRNHCDIPVPTSGDYHSNACFQIQDNSRNFLIENNWLNGGNYTINCKTSTGVYGMTIRNNWFGTHRYGDVTGCAATGSMRM